MEEPSKVCKVCGRKLPYSQFRVCRYCSGGRAFTCKECGAKLREEQINKLLAKKLSDESIASQWATVFDDNCLISELKKRGYSGVLRITQSVSI